MLIPFVCLPFLGQGQNIQPIAGGGGVFLYVRVRSQFGTSILFSPCILQTI